MNTSKLKWCYFLSYFALCWHSLLSWFYVNNISTESICLIGQYKCDYRRILCIFFFGQLDLYAQRLSYKRLLLFRFISLIIGRNFNYNKQIILSNNLRSISANIYYRILRTYKDKMQLITLIWQSSGVIFDIISVGFFTFLSRRRQIKFFLWPPLWIWSNCNSIRLHFKSLFDDSV